MSSWEHTAVVLKFKEKGFSVSRKDVVQGLDGESVEALKAIGGEGWEVVAVLPFSTGGVGLFSNAQTKTDAAIAFFKRPAASPV